MTSIPCPVRKRVPTTLSEIQSARLIEHCLAGNQTAWNQLVHLYKPLVFSYARHLAGNTEDAGDITSQVFLRLYQSLHTFHHDRPFYAWLFRVVYHSYIDLCLRNRENRHLSLDAPPVKGQIAFADRLVDTTCSPETAVLQQDTLQRIIEGIDHLPHYQRQAILLFMQGSSYEQIAWETGRSMGTVKSRIYRARNTLSARLEVE